MFSLSHSRIHCGVLRQLLFFYETSTGRTTWDRPDYPAEVLELPDTLRRNSGDTRLEGVVLDQTQVPDAHLRKQTKARCQEASLQQHACKQLKRRQRGGSYDKKRIHTDVSVKKELVEDDEPQKASFEKLNIVDKHAFGALQMIVCRANAPCFAYSCEIITTNGSEQQASNKGAPPVL